MSVWRLMDIAGEVTQLYGKTGQFCWVERSSSSGWGETLCFWKITVLLHISPWKQGPQNGIFPLLQAMRDSAGFTKTCVRSLVKEQKQTEKAPPPSLAFFLSRRLWECVPKLRKRQEHLHIKSGLWMWTFGSQEALAVFTGNYNWTSLYEIQIYLK